MRICTKGRCAMVVSDVMSITKLQRSPGVDAVEYRGPSQHEALWLCFARSTERKQFRYGALREGARDRDQRGEIKGELCTYSVCRATLTDSIVHRSNLCQDRATEQAK